MNEILDSNLDPQQEIRNITYGKFWPRTGALVLDGLVIGVPLIAITFLNISWKNVPLLVISSFVGLAYKPWMEYRYNATLGKMALGLKVVDYGYQSPSLATILLRNIFGLGSGFLSLIVSVLLFLSPEFQDVNGFMEYSALVNSRPDRYIQWAFNAITIVEIIVLLVDDRCRSLHDKIARTYVIAK